MSPAFCRRSNAAQDLDRHVGIAGVEGRGIDASAPGFTRSRGISRTTLPSHWVNLNGGTSLATSIAEFPASTSWMNLIQLLRMPVSPSGSRTRCGPTAFDSVRNTVSLSGSGMLPTKCAIGRLLRSAMTTKPRC